MILPPAGFKQPIPDPDVAAPLFTDEPGRYSDEHANAIAREFRDQMRLIPPIVRFGPFDEGDRAIRDGFDWTRSPMGPDTIILGECGCEYCEHLRGKR